VIGGFWNSFISQFGISGFVNTLGATLAPIYGIMIVDYYLLRKQVLNRDALYDLRGGEYHYGNGWNNSALIAFCIAAVFSVATVWVPVLASLSGYAWVFGAVIGGAIFYLLAKKRTA
jgi:nucleobase:cation symporter-1, NCS1 family